MAKQRRVEDPNTSNDRAINQSVLAGIEARRTDNLKEIPDLGLGLKHERSGTAEAFFRDEFDRKAFGDEMPTISKIIYGPDPLIDKSPVTRAAIEKVGLLDYAEEMGAMILQRGASAMPDPSLRLAMQSAILEFGVEAVAEAFKKRILQIPSKVVQYEVDRDVDVETSGTGILADTIARYGRPGMSYKFLSDACLKVLGPRGYQFVFDEKGDPVKCGTLVLGELPQWKAEQRRRRWAMESQEKVQSITESFTDEANRVADRAGAVGAGSGALRTGEIFRVNASSVESLEGQTRPVGFTVEAQA